MNDGVVNWTARCQGGCWKLSHLHQGHQLPRSHHVPWQNFPWLLAKQLALFFLFWGGSSKKESSTVCYPPVSMLYVISVGTGTCSVDGCFLFAVCFRWRSRAFGDTACAGVLQDAAQWVETHGRFGVANDGNLRRNRITTRCLFNQLMRFLVAAWFSFVAGLRQEVAAYALDRYFWL